jgi:hypothetical protein
VDVVPETGATVGGGGGGSGVSDGSEVGAGGSVAVMMSGVVAVGISVWTEMLQPATRKLTATRRKVLSFICTTRF